jgi:amidase
VKIPPWRDLVRAWPAVCAAEAAVAHERWFPSRADEYGPELRAFLEAGRSAPATTYAKAHEERLVFEARLAELFDEIDLILCPSLGVQLPPANPPIADDPEALETVLRFTAPYDFSGSPTLSLPCGFSADGLPVSLQLVGRHLGEEALLRAGRALERATKWHRRHPAL